MHGPLTWSSHRYCVSQLIWNIELLHVIIRNEGGRLTCVAQRGRRCNGVEGQKHEGGEMHRRRIQGAQRSALRLLNTTLLYVLMERHSEAGGQKHDAVNHGQIIDMMQTKTRSGARQEVAEVNTTFSHARHLSAD